MSEAVLSLQQCSATVQRTASSRSKLDANIKELPAHMRQARRESLSANRALHDQYRAMLKCQEGSGTMATQLRELQKKVIMEGLPAQRDANLVSPGDEKCSLRGQVWKLLLGALHVDAMLYIRLVELGASGKDAKIREDTFRTFQGNHDFSGRVPQEKLSRLNNAFVRLHFRDGRFAVENKDGEAGKLADQPIGNDEGGYVQGMTVLSGPLLYAMPEVDAFFCFNVLLTKHMPSYVTPNLDGVHMGCILVDKVLQEVDVELYNYLQAKFLRASIYAFPLLMSLLACMPPFQEVLKLWDALFACGVHLNVMLTVAQVVLLRDKLLQDPNPYNHLNPRYLPPLNAEVLLAAAYALVPHVPEELMEQVVAHPLRVNHRK